MPDEPYAPKDGTFVADEMVRAWLRKPFPPEQIGTLPKGGRNLSYVGHAAVTDRLNKLVPDWTWAPERIVETPDGEHVLAVIGSVTIGGKTMPEVGEPANRSSYGQELQTAIGNLIRRGAMRFGVGIDLWSREELEATEGKADTSKRQTVKPSGPSVTRSGASLAADGPDPISPDSAKGSRQTEGPREGEARGPSVSTKYPKSATACGADAHPAWVDGESVCPDCGAPIPKVLADRAKA